MHARISRIPTADDNSVQHVSRVYQHVLLIPGLPNEIWHMIVLDIYGTLPEQYREHAVHTLRCVSRAWRSGVEGMSALWTLITHGRAVVFPRHGIHHSATNPITLPRYTAISEVEGEGAGQNGEVQAFDYARREEEELFVHRTWNEFTPQQKRALYRFYSSFKRSAKRDLTIRITLRKSEGILLRLLMSGFLENAARVVELDLDIPRTMVHERAHEFALMLREEDTKTSSTEQSESDRNTLHTTARLIDCGRVTSLKLCNVCFLEAAHPLLLLRHCPALVSLTVECNAHWNLHDRASVSFGKPLVFRSLEQLTTEMSFLINLWKDGITTPRLTHLCLTNPCNLDLDHRILQPPSYGWMHKLETLGLSGTFTDDSIKKYLLHTPMLRRLKLKYCGGTSLFREVLPSTASYTGIGAITIAPRLEYLGVVDGYVDDASVIAALDTRICNRDGLPTILMFDLRSCPRTTPWLGMVLLKRARGLWWP